MDNEFIVDFDKREVSLKFKGKEYSLTLDDQDLEDHWHSITDAEGTIYDINIYLPSADSISCSAYPLIVDADGFFNTADTISHRFFLRGTNGDGTKYFDNNNFEYCATNTNLNKQMKIKKEILLLGYDIINCNSCKTTLMRRVSDDEKQVCWSCRKELDFDKCESLYSNESIMELVHN